jgi:hypothetical protein
MTVTDGVWQARMPARRLNHAPLMGNGYRKGKHMVSIVVTVEGSEAPLNRQGWVDVTCKSAVILGDNARDFIVGCHDGWHDASQ